MSLEEFLDICKFRGWHFTHNWVLRKLRDHQKLVAQTEKKHAD